MFEFLLGYVTKPVLGLTILLRLFGGETHGPGDPWVENIKFVQIADSVFVHATIQNGLTPEIKDLLESGVIIKTTGTFSCGNFTQQFERAMHYNPVKRSGYYFSPGGIGKKTFNEDSLSFYFAAIIFYCADVNTLAAMRSLPAKITISTSINVEAMAIGEKKLWPGQIAAEFAVPELRGKK